MKCLFASALCSVLLWSSCLSSALVCRCPASFPCSLNSHSLEIHAVLPPAQIHGESIYQLGKKKYNSNLMNSKLLKIAHFVLIVRAWLCKIDRIMFYLEIQIWQYLLSDSFFSNYTLGIREFHFTGMLFTSFLENILLKIFKVNKVSFKKGKPGTKVFF